MKRFIIEVDDDVTEGDIKEYLYHGSQQKKVWKTEPIEIQETNKRADDSPRMTTKQRDKLWEVCGRYNVPFRESDYVFSGGAFGTPGMVEGWIGGPMMNGHNNQGKTIYMGVEVDGSSHT
jgi:hypothetical protein